MSEVTRREIVEQVLHNNAMEGLYVSKEQAVVIEEWIIGNITIEDMIEQTKQRYIKE